MTAAGTLRHHITIQKNEPTTDASRQRVDNWVTTCSRRAGIVPVRVSERYQPQANSEVLITHTITVRHDSKTALIDEGWRIKYQPVIAEPAQYFSVQASIDPDGGLRRFVELQVVERAFER